MVTLRRIEHARRSTWRSLAAAAAVVGLCGAAQAGTYRASHSVANVGCSPLVVGVHADLQYEGDVATRVEVVSAAKNILRARIARSTLLWNWIEPVQGKRDWTAADAAVNEQVAAGIEPLLVLMGSPQWANGVPQGVNGRQWYVPTGDGDFAAWLGRFASFAHDAALRYKGKVHRWEIWNEPNLATFWRPVPDINRYAQTYKRIRDAIQTADPKARVAVGGLAVLAIAWGNINISGLAFLEGLIARNIRPPFVAVHPYTTPPHAPDQEIQGQDNFADIARVHELLRSRGIRTSIWVTEWGWSSQDVGLIRQAEYLQRSLEMLRDQFWYVTVATYFIDHDRPPRSYYGLLDSSLRPKPAAARFAAAARRFQRCRDRGKRRTSNASRLTQGH